MSVSADARRLCQVIARDTDRRPMRWKMASEAADLADLKADRAAAAIAHAVKSGWLIEEGGHSVALTDAGRKL